MGFLLLWVQQVKVKSKVGLDGQWMYLGEQMGLGQWWARLEASHGVFGSTSGCNWFSSGCKMIWSNQWL
jgi:hypothetical protein